MKTLTIFVRNDSLVFELLGVPYNDSCPRVNGLQWWRGWDSNNFGDWREVTLRAAPRCVLGDVLDQGITDIAIVASLPKLDNSQSNPPELACSFYDAVLKLLSSPPEGTPAYLVRLHDVRHLHGGHFYPVGRDWTSHRVCVLANVEPKRKVGKMPELAMGFGSPDAADALALTFARPISEALATVKGAPAAADFEKLEARVLALETARRADWWTFRKSPGFGGTMYGVNSQIWSAGGAIGPHGPGKGGPGRTHYWVDESTAVPFPPKTYYSKMVLRIGVSAHAGLDQPSNITNLQRPAEFIYSLSEVEVLARKLRQLKVRELTLRRHSGAPMEKMTEWLVAIVNASSPVMKITSDPEMMK